MESVTPRVNNVDCHQVQIATVAHFTNAASKPVLWHQGPAWQRKLHTTCRMPGAQQQQMWGNEECTLPRAEAEVSRHPENELYCSSGGDGCIPAPNEAAVVSTWFPSTFRSGTSRHRPPEVLRRTLYDCVPLFTDTWWGIELVFYGCSAKLLQA